MLETVFSAQFKSYYKARLHELEARFFSNCEFFSSSFKMWENVVY